MATMPHTQPHDQPHDQARDQPHAHHTVSPHDAGRAATPCLCAATHTHSAPASPVEAEFRHPAFPYATFPLRRRGRHSPPLDGSLFVPPSEANASITSSAAGAVVDPSTPPSFVDPFTGAPARAPSAPSGPSAPSFPTGGVSMVRSVSQPVLTSAEAAAYAASRAQRRRQRSRPSIIGVFPRAGSSRASASSASAATTELADPPEEEEDDVDYEAEDVLMAESFPTLPLSPTPRVPPCSGPQRTPTSVLEPRLTARPYPATPSPPPLARQACALRRLTPSPRNAESDHAAGSCATAQSTISRAAAWRSASFKLARAVRD